MLPFFTAARGESAGLTVIFADHLSLSNIYDQSRSPVPADAIPGAVIALVSPGLPRGGDPAADLYATLTAGDVASITNEHVGLLQRQLAASGADNSGHVALVRFGDVRAPGRMQALRALIQRLRSPSSPLAPVNARTGGKNAVPQSGRQPGILLVGVVPPPARNGGQWDSLTPIVWLSCGGGGSDPAAQPTLTSDTTQTAGLIALRDVAPTILDAEGLPIPDSMSGHQARLARLGARQSRDALLRRMDTLARTNHRALPPFGWLFGLGGGAILLTAIWCILTENPRAAPLLRYLVRFLLAVPLAQLVTPLLYVNNAAVYLLEMTLIALVIAYLIDLRRLLWLSAGVLVIDAFCGTPLISRSLFSGYWLSGIRFYGIGNEYMGILLGMALLAPVLANPSVFLRTMPFRIGKDGKPGHDAEILSERTSALEKHKPAGLPVLYGQSLLPMREGGGGAAVWVAFWFLLVLVVLAYPQFGAKAGGAVTAMATFLPCWWALVKRRSPSAWVWIVGVALGFVAIFTLSALSHHLGGRTTHIQAATDALAHGKLGYIAHMAVRKAKMAVKIALSPGAFGGIIGVGIVALIWMRSNLRTRADAFLSNKDALRYALIAGLWGMLACVLFNDSGAVAALLLGGVLALTLVHEMLTELCVSSPLMSEMSGSASQSATSLSSAPTRSSP